VSSSDYVVSNDKLLVEISVWREVIVAEVKLLSWNLHGRYKGIYIKPLKGSGLRLKVSSQNVTNTRQEPCPLDSSARCGRVLETCSAHCVAN
jgi:hypothetical protein